MKKNLIQIQIETKYHKFLPEFRNYLKLMINIDSIFYSQCINKIIFKQKNFDQFFILDHKNVENSQQTFKYKFKFVKKNHSINYDYYVIIKK
ncbi:hypothetical protein BpHYR1_013930 [Brachionus plicatilis]|uniref:Uncharacterized protein n=1 Tax=Brachionus plicatilis TaxID=10195 RepID=A0A3M7R5A0_BRAPC|nr:hypothetical protein BpHYR1_013930 [Brachionus plicatilis]